jgi:endonuclease/exonuclease/phosphatase family metal-dependent hydrolase
MFPGIDTLHSYDLLSLINAFFTWLRSVLQGPGLQAIADWFNSHFPGITDQALNLAFFMSAVFLWGVIYYSMKIYNLHKHDNILKFATPPPEEIHNLKMAPDIMKQRWNRVVEHISSTADNDWKLAILEADIMLDEMLDRQGYHGESLGDKLKKVETADFDSINEAWEAHKIRNQIAHEGSAFMLSQRQAKETVGMYEKVFREFRMI